MPVPAGLRGLAAFDPELIGLLRSQREALEARTVHDVRTIELIRLGTLIGIGAASDAIASHVRRLRADGATDDEVWGVVLAVLPVVGVARVVQAGEAITTALADAAQED